MWVWALWTKRGGGAQDWPHFTRASFASLEIGNESTMSQISKTFSDVLTDNWYLVAFMHIPHVESVLSHASVSVGYSFLRPKSPFCVRFAPLWSPRLTNDVIFSSSDASYCPLSFITLSHFVNQFYTTMTDTCPYKCHQDNACNVTESSCGFRDVYTCTCLPSKRLLFSSLFLYSELHTFHMPHNYKKTTLFKIKGISLPPRVQIVLRERAMYWHTPKTIDYNVL